MYNCLKLRGRVCKKWALRASGRHVVIYVIRSKLKALGDRKCSVGISSLLRTTSVSSFVRASGLGA
jgi:hypothetical protein